MQNKDFTTVPGFRSLWAIIFIILASSSLFLTAFAEIESGTQATDPVVNVDTVFSEHSPSEASMNESHSDETAEISSHESHSTVSHGEGGLAEEMHARAEDMSKKLPLWAGLPFLGILLSIALFPIFAPHFWHKHYPKVSLFWALSFAVPFFFAYQGLAFYEILHIYLVDYIPFIILLWGLYTVSGGIVFKGSLVGTPLLNLQFLLVGTVLASWMGTTGASMLMIRPLLRANAGRKSKMHVVIFFIFLVSNIGGALTPLGDPPLFLGFLHGVPFFWTLKIFPEFIVAAGILFVVFFIIDTVLYRREGAVILEHVDVEHKHPVRLEGVHNFLFLGGIVAAVLMSGTVHLGHVSIYGVHVAYQNLLRDLCILFMGFLSMKTTHKQVRIDNDFNWFPILEVAYLFAGIFITIIPMLAILRAGVHGSLAFIINFVKEPYHYFWITGILSSFLDNAPTYLTFFNLALGRMGITEQEMTLILKGLSDHGAGAEFVTYLKGIASGAVFFGAMTYIGNAPNFMVRSIAEESGIKMPSFFGYMLWSVAILVPTFLVVTLIFF